MDDVTRYIETDPSSALGLMPERPMRFAHSIAASGLFEDSALEDLLHGYPSRDLHVTTMGRTFAEGGWRTGEIVDLSGPEILRAVKHGHLWLNIKYLHLHSPAFAMLMDRLYGEIVEESGERQPDWRAATLLISSPSAFVHYHADSVPNILWHVRGRKRVMVYPAMEEEFAPVERLEQICAGELDEGLPYSADFERAAETIELEPGTGAMWPQNAPHRVENIEGFNVSLSTEHLTPAARRRVNVMRANRILRKRLNLAPRSTASHGVSAAAKEALALAQRAVTKLRRRPPTSFAMPASFRLDPESPTGYVDLPHAGVTSACDAPT